MNSLKPMLLTSLKSYNRSQFIKDVTAGIIVAIIALPLSIALALASGVGPEAGIFTAIVAGFVISALGGSSVQIAGPTAAFATIVAGIVAKDGMDELVIATPVTQHYLEMQNHAITFQDFMKDPIIIREKGSGTKKEMDIFLEKLGITSSDLNVIARMNDLESIKKSIVNGLGISILSARSTIDLQKTKQILLFPLEESAHKRSFYIVYSKNRILKSHVRQFIHYVKEYYQTV